MNLPQMETLSGRKWGVVSVHINVMISGHFTGSTFVKIFQNISLNSVWMSLTKDFGMVVLWRACAQNRSFNFYAKSIMSMRSYTLWCFSRVRFQSHDGRNLLTLEERGSFRIHHHRAVFQFRVPPPCH